MPTEHGLSQDFRYPGTLLGLTSEGSDGWIPTDAEEFWKCSKEICYTCFTLHIFQNAKQTYVTF